VRGVVLEGASPAAFGQALDRAMAICKRRQSEDQLLFIKSWNEWGEGNHLEPCRQFGRGYLQEIQRRR